jgi:hypothetical protein
MKIQHAAAALALAGWYLVTPPKINSRFNTAAPLLQWKIESGFASDEDCKSMLAVLASKARKEGERDEIEKVKAARCVASGDPRLKGKF